MKIPPVKTEVSRLEFVMMIFRGPGVAVGETLIVTMISAFAPVPWKAGMPVIVTPDPLTVTVDPFAAPMPFPETISSFIAPRLISELDAANDNEVAVSSAIPRDVALRPAAGGAT